MSARRPISMLSLSASTVSCQGLSPLVLILRRPPHENLDDRVTRLNWLQRLICQATALTVRIVLSYGLVLALSFSHQNSHQKKIFTPCLFPFLFFSFSSSTKVASKDSLFSGSPVNCGLSTCAVVSRIVLHSPTTCKWLLSIMPQIILLTLVYQLQPVDFKRYLTLGPWCYCLGCRPSALFFTLYQLVSDTTLSCLRPCANLSSPAPTPCSGHLHDKSLNSKQWI